MQHAGRIRRPLPGKTTAEAHDYHDAAPGVLASSLTKPASAPFYRGRDDASLRPTTGAAGESAGKVSRGL